MNKATKNYKSGKIICGWENRLNISRARQEAMKPFLDAYAKNIRTKRALTTVGIVFTIPAITGLAEAGYNGVKFFFCHINQSFKF